MPIKGFFRFGDLKTRFPEIVRNNPTEGVFVCRELPTEEQLQQLRPSIVCSKCYSTNIGFVDAHINPPAAAMMTRCLDCLTEHFIYVTNEDTTSPDVSVFPGSSKSLYYRELFAQFKCPVCGCLWSDLGIDRSQYDIHVVLPVLGRCSNCRERFNVVFWDSPMTYFAEARRVGDKVIDVSPESALVFYTAAMENYLQKAFLFASEFNLFLVRSRKVTFQALDEAKRLYKYYFGIDLAQQAGSNWQLLREATRNRNLVLHNAAHDRNFNPISIDKAYAEGIRQAATDLVWSKLHNVLRRRCIY